MHRHSSCHPLPSIALTPAEVPCRRALPHPCDWQRLLWRAHPCGARCLICLAHFLHDACCCWCAPWLCIAYSGCPCCRRTDMRWGVFVVTRRLFWLARPSQCALPVLAGSAAGAQACHHPFIMGHVLHTVAASSLPLANLWALCVAYCGWRCCGRTGVHCGVLKAASSISGRLADSGSGSGLFGLSGLGLSGMLSWLVRLHSIDSLRVRWRKESLLRWPHRVASPRHTEASDSHG